MENFYDFSKMGVLDVFYLPDFGKGTSDFGVKCKCLGGIAFGRRPNR